MPTEKPRLTFTLDQETLAQIEQYRFGHKMKNQSKAILSLIEKGLETVEQAEKENPPASPESEDREITVEQLERMLVELGYIKPGEDLSDADLRFLLAVGQALRAWFADR